MRQKLDIRECQVNVNFSFLAKGKVLKDQVLRFFRLDIWIKFGKPRSENLTASGK